VAAIGDLVDLAVVEGRDQSRDRTVKNGHGHWRPRSGQHDFAKTGRTIGSEANPGKETAARLRMGVAL
jgi:hypothetical protein